MKRKGTTPVGCAGDIFVLERSIGEDRPSKRCGIREEVLGEDTSSGSRDGDNKVKHPWIGRDAITSEEDGEEISGTKARENGNGPLQEMEDSLLIVIKIAQLEIRRFYRSLIKEDEGVWRNPPLNHLPCTFVIYKK
jgi:hypothetical protein